MNKDELGRTILVSVTGNIYARYAGSKRQVAIASEWPLAKWEIEMFRTDPHAYLGQLMPEGNEE